jgi:hypothetical protein
MLLFFDEILFHLRQLKSISARPVVGKLSIEIFVNSLIKFVKPGLCAIIITDEKLSE